MYGGSCATSGMECFPRMMGDLEKNNRLMQIDYLINYYKVHVGFREMRWIKRIP